MKEEKEEEGSGETNEGRSRVLIVDESLKRRRWLECVWIVCLCV